MSKKVTKFIIFIFCVGLVAWILMNSYANIDFLRKIPSVATNVNNFFKMLYLNYRFSLQEIANSVRYIEYLLLGVFCTKALKLTFADKYKIYITSALCGLATAVTEAYVCQVKSSFISAQVIVVSFAAFVVGALVYLMCSAAKGGKKSKNKYNITSKYRR